MEIITTVTIRIGGLELNTKTMCWLKQASVSVEKVICSCDEPAPLPAFGELGGGGDRRDGGGSVHTDLAVPGLKAKFDALVCE